MEAFVDLASRPKSELPSVVHLVRHGTPLGSLERFLDSYRRHDAGVDHRLVLLCKGFGSPDELRPVLARLDGLWAERIDVPDDGYDLTAYRRAAERLGDGVACYLNSNSVLLCDGWLAPLLSALTPEVGIAGATGSWHSAHSNALYLLRLPSAYTTGVSRPWLASNAIAPACTPMARPARLQARWRTHRSATCTRPTP